MGEPPKELRGDEILIEDILIFAIVFGILLALMYFAKRYGKVVHGWVKLDKPQVEALKEANRRYRAMNPQAGPEGPPLYKRKLISHDGIVIYQNGIYAKFSLGKNGKYAFVPWLEISDIYPVKIENPYTKADSIWTGPASFKALQIETESSMVLLISSRAHDFEQLVPVLKRAMGPRWNQTYHEDETIWGNFMEGDILIHKSMRRQGAPRPTETRSFAMPPPMPVVEGKGKLLLEESQVDIKERAGAFVRGGMVLIIAGIVMTGIGVVLLFVGLPFFFVFLLVMFFIFGPMLIAVGLLLGVMSQKLKPVKIYENGIEASAPFGTRTFFFSFGELLDVTEMSNFIDGQIYFFRTSNPRQSIAIRKRMRGFPEMLDTIKPKLGREEFIVKGEMSPEEAVSSRRTEYGLYAVATFIAAFIGFLFILYVFSGQPFSLVLSGLGLVVPIFVMIAVTYMTSRMTKMQKLVPRRLNIKVPAAIVVGALAFILISVGLDFATSTPGASQYTTYIEPKPVSSSLAMGTYINATLSANGWILVDTGQVLQLVNTSLTMNLTSDRGFGIWVAEGGSIFISADSEVISSDPAFGYTFEIMGSAVIDNSMISGVWADPQQENYNGGLEIYSSDVVVNGTGFPNPKLNGILIMNSNPTIANSTITDAGDDGIEIHGSKAIIKDNAIGHCGYAMIIADGSGALIEHNSFSDNLHGIVVQSSSPVIRSNLFDHNSNYAIRYDSASHMALDNNHFVNNQADTVEESGLYLIGACGVITVMLAVACLLVLFWIHKEQLRKENDQLGRFGRLEQH